MANVLRSSTIKVIPSICVIEHILVNAKRCMVYKKKNMLLRWSFCDGHKMPLQNDLLVTNINGCHKNVELLQPSPLLSQNLCAFATNAGCHSKGYIVCNHCRMPSQKIWAFATKTNGRHKSYELLWLTTMASQKTYLLFTR